jgi:hypothetical protein
LRTLLVNATNVAEPNQQYEFIIKINSWFQTKYGAYKSNPVPKSSVSTTDSEKGDCSAREKRNCQDPMDGRTVHKEVAPAKDRIMDYRRHVLNTSTQYSSRPTTATTNVGRPFTANSVSKQSSRRFINREIVGRDFDGPITPIKIDHTDHDISQDITSGRISIEGKSNFYAYKAVGDTDLMKLEQRWFERQNRKVQEKR